MASTFHWSMTMSTLRKVAVTTALFLGSAAALGAATAPSGISKLGPAHPAALLPAIMHAYESGAKQIRIPPGNYKLPKPKGAYYLTFKNIKNFSIIAPGVTLLLADAAKGGILFSHCRNVELRGLTLRIDPLPFTEGRIVAVGKHHRSLTFRVARGYSAAQFQKAKFPSGSVGTIFDPHTFEMIPGNWNFVGPRAHHPVTQLGPRKFRIHCTTAMSSVRPGDLLAFTFRNHLGADTSVDVNQCRGMRIDHVTVMGGPGFCFLEEGGEGGNHYIADRIAYPPKPSGARLKPLLAAIGGFASGQARRGPTLRDCRFEGIDDDAIVIHGSYAALASAKGRRWIIVSPWHIADYIHRGDQLKLYTHAGHFLGQVRAMHVAPLPHYHPHHKLIANMAFAGTPRLYYAVTVSHGIAHAGPGDRIADVNANGSGFRVENCLIQGNLNRGILANGDNGMIVGNTFRGCTIAGIVAGPEFYWNDAGSACNLLVADNVLENVARTQGTYSAEAGAISITTDPAYHGVANFSHRGIMVIGNRFVHDNGINILLTDARDVLVADNRFLQPMRTVSHHGATYHFGTSSLIWLQQCRGVLLAGNRVVDAGDAMKKLVGCGPAVSDVHGLKSGVKRLANNQGAK